MALELAFRIALSSDGETLTVTDRTGTYSGLQVGGFGSPNPAVTGATSATIAISKRASDGTYGDVISVDAFDDLPSSIAGTFDISATDGVDADTYADGIYKIVYTVAGSSGGTPFSTSVTRYDTLRNDIAICYQAKIADFAVCNCNCDDIKADLKCMAILMRLLCAAEACGNLEEIQKYLDKLTSVCTETNCGC